VVGVPALAGVNLYLTVFALGLIKKLTGVTVLGPEFGVFASWPVLIVAGVLALVELVADKIPAVDHVWDAVHTFIRTPGAMVVIAVVMQGQDPAWQVVAILVSGAVSFAFHSGKATLRATSTKTTATVANAAISLGEDVGVGFGAWLAAYHPLVLGGVILALLALAIIFGPRVARSVRLTWLVGSRYLVYLYERVRRWLDDEWRPRRRPVRAPAAAADRHLRAPAVYVARVIVGPFGRRRLGYLLAWNDRLALAVRRWFKWRLDEYYYKELEGAAYAEYVTVGQLEFRVRGRRFLLTFLKGLTPTAEQLARLIAAGQARS